MDRLLAMEGINKSFPGVKALKDVRFDLRSGEVHALIGENGAGKSTLMKILTGSYIADSGTIKINGKTVDIKTPKMAQDLGINIIHQEIHLFPDLSVAENIFIGCEPRLKGANSIIDWTTIKKRAREILDSINLKVDVDELAGRLSVAQQQMVAIARILAMKSKIVIMDEPTATLADAEVKELFRIIDMLKSQGVGIIYISHRLEELAVMADRVTVLRDGAYIKTLEYKDTSIEELISLMVGRKLEDQFPAHNAKAGKTLLEVKRLKTAEGLDISGFELREGEILGIYGLVGAGRTEFARALFGADKSTEYDVRLNGQKINVKTPLDAVKYGIGYITEDRKGEGLALNMNVEFNVNLANIPSVSRLGVVNDKKCCEIARYYVKDLKIKTPSIEQLAKHLSGGNQQKVILAKWLSRNVQIIIFDEPTRGIDVGAKKEVYNLINRLVESGVGVIVISSELPEILGISDRIMVMRDMKFTCDLTRAEATQEKLLSYAIV